MYCIYYQARVDIPQTWFVTATLRSFEHCSFDRALNPQEGIIEFFVPKDTNVYFLELMDYYIQKGLVTDLKELPNRLAQPNAVVNQQ